MPAKAIAVKGLAVQNPAENLPVHTCGISVLLVAISQYKLAS